VSTTTGAQALLMPEDFRVDGRLPEGTTVLEASAGTGKTFTIAALATRYVAEGLAELPELMLVTFGREATQELRERVRERLLTTERGLASGGQSGDPVIRLLADAPAEEVARRRSRLRLALAHFDAATNATSSASRCSPGWAWPGTATRMRSSSSTWTTWSPRSSTTSTCASTPRPRPGGRT
jgi:exodeoxyribonuclease V beta subunit